jgi:hypothetical protein
MPDEAGAGVIAVRIRELDQFFNSMDPSPFHEMTVRVVRTGGGPA